MGLSHQLQNLDKLQLLCVHQYIIYPLWCQILWKTYSDQALVVLVIQHVHGSQSVCGLFTPSAKSEGGNINISINISILSAPNTGDTVIILIHRTVGNRVISNLALAFPVKLVDFPTIYFFCMENKLNSCLKVAFTFLEKS